MNTEYKCMGHWWSRYQHSIFDVAESLHGSVTGCRDRSHPRVALLEHEWLKARLGDWSKSYGAFDDATHALVVAACLEYEKRDLEEDLRWMVDHKDDAGEYCCGCGVHRDAVFGFGHALDDKMNECRERALMTKPNEPEFCCCGPGEAKHHQSVYLALVAPVGVKFGADWLASDFVRAFNCVAVLNRGVFCSECGLGVRPGVRP